MRSLLNSLYAKHTNKTIEAVGMRSSFFSSDCISSPKYSTIHLTMTTLVEKAMDRDNFMSAQEAVNFGLIDKVLVKRETNLEGEKTTTV